MSRITIGPVRMSYVYVFTPRPAQGGMKEKYGASLLIPKEAKDTYNAIMKAITTTRQEYLNKNTNAAWVNNVRTTLYDGDGIRQNGEPFSEECHKHWVLGTSTTKPPVVVDSNKQQIINPNEVYSGVFANCVINFYVYEVANSRGIACSLDGVMKMADGPALSGYTITNNDWDNVAANDLAELQALLA